MFLTSEFVVIKIRLWQRQPHQLINTIILRIIQIQSHYKVIIYAVFTINASYSIQHRPLRHQQHSLIQPLKLYRVVVQVTCWYRQKCKCKVHYHHSSPIYYWPIEVYLVFTISSRVLLGKWITTENNKEKIIFYWNLKLGQNGIENFTQFLEIIYIPQTNSSFFRKRIEKEMTLKKKRKRMCWHRKCLLTTIFNQFFFLRCLI